MGRKQVQVYPLNRVEGDLKIHLEIDDDAVIEARSAGTMYRGFENIMVGRGPLDGLVITPRICGICTTAHLNAAARALDDAFEARVPDNGRRLRNVTLMAEMLQNDVRHAILLYMADFTRPRFADTALYDTVCRRYTPLSGESARSAIRASRRILEIVAILGGQWPHSSFMVPGGVVSVPSTVDITQCRYILSRFRRWYERRILGTTIERWREIDGAAALSALIDGDAAVAESDLGVFVRFARAAGLDRIGRGLGRFISFGAFQMPRDTTVASLREGNTHLLPAGVGEGTAVAHFHQERISESIDHSWFTGYTGGRHPFEGLTQPYATGREGPRYSWCKSVGYDERPAETGPLAQLVIAKNPLITDLVRTEGPSAFVRELARMVRPAILIPAMDQWLREMGDEAGPFYREHARHEDADGCGLTEAPRGALGHWIKIRKNRIQTYQIITPTAWNGSPRNGQGRRGPWEEALVGTAIADPSDPIEADLVIRSFDPCLVCTVHAADFREEGA